MTTATATATTRVIRDYDKPLWRRLLLTREAAIVGLLLLVAIVSASSIRGFDSPSR